MEIIMMEREKEKEMEMIIRRESWMDLLYKRYFLYYNILNELAKAGERALTF